MIFLIAGTAVVALLNSSMLLAIAQVTGKPPDPPPLPRPAAPDLQKKPGIEDTPCTEEGIAELIRIVQRKRRIAYLPDRRIPAAKRLGDCGAAAALPALEKMSKDKDPEVKAVALDAIAKIKKAN